MKTLVYTLAGVALFAMTACGPDMRTINNASEKAEADATQAEAAANSAEASATQADAAANQANQAASGAEDAVRRANDAVSRLEAYFASSVTK
jgi:ABC-type transporter Mla subunit MlaD